MEKLVFTAFNPTYRLIQHKPQLGRAQLFDELNDVRLTFRIISDEYSEFLTESGQSYVLWSRKIHFSERISG